MKENKDLNAILEEKQVRVNKATGKSIVDTYFEHDEIVHIYDDSTYSRMVAQSDFDDSWIENERFYAMDIVSTSYDSEKLCYKYKLTQIGEKLIEHKVIEKSVVYAYIKKQKEADHKRIIENANNRLQHGLQEAIGNYKTIVDNAVGLEEYSKKLLDLLKETISKHVHITL